MFECHVMKKIWLHIKSGHLCVSLSESISSYPLGQIDETLTLSEISPGFCVSAVQVF